MTTVGTVPTLGHLRKGGHLVEDPLRRFTMKIRVGRRPFFTPRMGFVSLPVYEKEESTGYTSGQEFLSSNVSRLSILKVVLFKVLT